VVSIFRIEYYGKQKEVIFPKRQLTFKRRFEFDSMRAPSGHLGFVVDKAALG
jgi:hypothetical protein